MRLSRLRKFLDSTKTFYSRGGSLRFLAQLVNSEEIQSHPEVAIEIFIEMANEELNFRDEFFTFLNRAFESPETFQNTIKILASTDCYKLIDNILIFSKKKTERIEETIESFFLDAIARSRIDLDLPSFREQDLDENGEIDDKDIRYEEDVNVYIANLLTKAHKLPQDESSLKRIRIPRQVGDICLLYTSIFETLKPTFYYRTVGSENYALASSFEERESLSVIYKNEDYIAGNVLRDIPVMKDTDKYYVYASEYRLPETARANHSPANVVTWEMSTSAYYLSKHSLKDAISPDDRDNTDAPINLDRDTTEYLTDKILLRQFIAL